MPDFGIFRGFNEKLFGDKLVAGQLPTELGLIGSESFGTDVDALAFFARVTAAGGTLSETEQLAIDTLVKQMKLDGIWTKMKAIYPMVGASVAACSRNLKSDNFNGTFTATGWTFASTGATPNGTSAFMNTGLISNLYFDSTTGQHLCVYNPTTSTGMPIGGGSGATNNQSYMWKSITHGILGGGAAETINNTPGFSLITYISGRQKTFNNNSKTADSIRTFSGFGNNNVFISAYTNNGTTGQLYDSAENRFASIGDGLTDTEASNFYNAVQAFQTTLSRNV